MLGRLVMHALGAAILAIPSPMSAQDGAHGLPDQIIDNAWTDPSDCNLANAIGVSFSDLASDAEKFSGQCVTVEGYWFGRALFSSPQHAGVERSNTSEQVRENRIGLYADWEQIGDPTDKPTRTVITGRVGRCETQWPDAMMVMGYCHYSGGPILLVSQAQQQK